MHYDMFGTAERMYSIGLSAEVPYGYRRHEALKGWTEINVNPTVPGRTV
jgi:hypothetical protein